jgi:hypothetical protein
MRCCNASCRKPPPRNEPAAERASDDVHAASMGSIHEIHQFPLGESGVSLGGLGVRSHARIDQQKILDSVAVITRPIHAVHLHRKDPDCADPQALIIQIFTDAVQGTPLEVLRNACAPESSSAG